MQVQKTTIADALIIAPEIFGDQRGFFMELYQKERYASCGLERSFLQDNLSRSARGVLRGLHFQTGKPQGKLVTVLHGAVLDVIVDVRVGSPTFGAHAAIELNDENRRQVWVPRGLAHGFLVLSEFADFFYKCDNPYNPTDEVVLRWNDPALGLEWGCQSPTLSPRDRGGRTLAELKDLLPSYQAEGCEY